MLEKLKTLHDAVHRKIDSFWDKVFSFHDHGTKNEAEPTLSLNKLADVDEDADIKLFQNIENLRDSIGKLPARVTIQEYDELLARVGHLENLLGVKGP